MIFITIVYSSAYLLLQQEWCDVLYNIGDTKKYVTEERYKGTIFFCIPTGSITDEGELRLDTSPDVNGMLTVTVDKQQVSAVLGGNSLQHKTYCEVFLPEETEGYSVATEDPVKLDIGSDFSFTVTVQEGYDSTQMKVFANDLELTPVDGVYTVTNIMGDVKIRVTGVVDKDAPDVILTVGENKWTKLLNIITFGLFFNKTIEAELTATDVGSGLHAVFYQVSSEPIILDDLENGGWIPYVETVKLEADGMYVIYGKAVDNAGNVCYINSDGMVIDTVAPGVNGIEDGAVYEGEVTFTVEDDSSVTVTINGEPVEGHVFTLKPAEGEQIIVITDGAGNTTTIRVTVNEVPKPEEPEDPSESEDPSEPEDPDDPVCDGSEGCPGSRFSDMDPTAWYHPDTDYVISNGLMQGYGDGTFRPEVSMSRAMVVQVLYNIEGRPTIVGKDPYTDTEEDAWYADAVLWATEVGIINGYGNNLFGPHDPVTREQMSTIFYRYSAAKGYSLTEGNYDHFSDKDTVSKYADTAMRWAVGNGLIRGMGNNTLCPKAETSRAQFAAVIRRFCETLAK